MKHILLALTTLIATPIITNGTTNTIMVPQNQTTNKNIYHIEETKNQYNKTQTEFDKNLEYRLYIDTTNDTLTPTHNTIDFNLGYQAKDTWYDIELPIAMYNFKDFNVSTRDALISTVGSDFKLDYYYAFNMWDSWKGWRNSGGKDVALTKASDAISLKTDAETKQVQYDKASSGTEASRIQIRQEWSGKGLTIYVRMSVWYYWAWGSSVEHATLTKFSLTNLDNGSGGTAKVKFDNKTKALTKKQSTLPGTYSLSLDWLFNNARAIYKEKNDNNWKSVFPLFVAYAMAGPLVCHPGTLGYSIINLLNYERLVEDIALIMATGLPVNNGSLRLVNTINESSLYYVDINDNIHHIVSTISVADACTTALYAGVTTLAYMYTIA